ncbi:hypothetical protein LCGC14_2461870 [marine sediment metagenome]|uniref:Uncharacterized protein n=1 Tax=marine sediment metagenome TaxID=412755 RepID=A0A0F9C0R3_9ZZZZ
MADITVPASLKGTAANAVTANAAIEGKIVTLQCAMLEFDLDGTLALASYLTMIPANLNKYGLIVTNVTSFVTELVATDAASPIITVRDGASSPNTLCTIAPEDADAIGECVPHTDSGFTTHWESLADNTDYTAQHVEAGVKVEAAVTTLAADAGTAAGKMLLLIEFYVIPSKE